MSLPSSAYGYVWYKWFMAVHGLVPGLVCNQYVVSSTGSWALPPLMASGRQ